MLAVAVEAGLPVMELEVQEEEQMLEVLVEMELQILEVEVEVLNMPLEM